MAIKTRSNIGCSLLAAALFGASTIGVCFAEEARSGAPAVSAGRDSSAPPSSEEAKVSASKPEGWSAVRAGGDSRPATDEGPPAGSPATQNAPAAGGVNLDGIDTSNTVQPRRLANGRPRIGPVKAISLGPRNLLAPRRLAPGRSQTTGRNAIGIPVVRSGSLERRFGGRHDFSISIVGHGASSSPGASLSTPDRLAKVEGPIDRPIVHANPVVRPWVLNRGTINGTTLSHRGIGPSNVGGPAKTVAGINGTSIRPVH